MPRNREKESVQEPLIRYACEVGWEYLSPDEARAMRGNNAETMLGGVVISQLQKLNPRFGLDEARNIFERLRRIPPNRDGNHQAWRYLKGQATIYLEAEECDVHVRLLDTDNIGANVFHVTDELPLSGGQHPDRADVVFFVNGVPVAFSETKSASNVGGMGEALEQVRRYHQEGPELLALMQLFNLTNISRFCYGATWNASRKSLFDWHSEGAESFEEKVKTFFDPARVVGAISDSILFTHRDGELQKVILRPHQMRAVEKIHARALDPEKRRGLIWHSQGSGKTYTMIVAAKKLLEDPSLENPTVLMLVDRTELEAQLFGNLESVGIENIVRAENKRELVRLLREGQPGLIVSMIHKFDDVPAGITDRENFFVLVDEAHRTTGGSLGNYLTGALPGATYIGFTGTPIDRTAHGEGTFKTFGRDDEQGYLDRYRIRQSIEDGTTVPLHYTLASNDLLVDRQTLEKEFLDLAELEGVSDVADINRVLERAVNLKNLLKNPERVSKIAAHIAEHFRQTVEPTGYKAFVVAPDREGCVLYKKALDEHLPLEWSEVVFSSGHNDPEELSEFHLADDRERQIRKDFRSPDELPKILIVTEKLLTGYDAPLLYAMYLDKPMRDHALLQAIARVNRPYEAGGRRKPSGFILDFVGIFDNLEKALAFDSEEVSGVVAGLDVLQKRFEELMQRGREDYLSIVGELKNDKAEEAILHHFRGAEAREEFYEFFRDLEDLYEILSPDAALRDYIEDYEELAHMYGLLKTAHGREATTLDRNFLVKTAQLVREHTTTSALRELESEWELTPEALRSLAEEEGTETVKVFNLVIAIRRLVGERAGESPALISIGERAEKIAEDFDNQQKEAGEALESLLDILDSLEEVEDRRKASGLSEEAFAIQSLLEGREVEKAGEIAAGLAPTLAANPLWKVSEDQGREVRIAFHMQLVAGEKASEKRTNLVNDILEILEGTAR